MFLCRRQSWVWWETWSQSLFLNLLPTCLTSEEEDLFYNALQCIAIAPVWDLWFAFHEMDIIQCTKMVKNGQKSEKCEHCHFHFNFSLGICAHWNWRKWKFSFSPQTPKFISPPPLELSRSALVSDQTIIEISSASKHSINEKCNIMKSSLPANNLMVHLNFAVLVPNSSSNSRNSRFGWRLQSNFQINSQFDLKWLAGVRALVQLLLFLFPTFISRKPN